jgi:excisionase family DNA binding protein
MTELPRAFSVAQVAEILGVSRQQVYDSIRRGELRAYKFGGLYRIWEHDLAGSPAAAGPVSQTAGTYGESRIADMSPSSIETVSDADVSHSARAMKARRRARSQT